MNRRERLLHTLLSYTAVILDSYSWKEGRLRDGGASISVIKQRGQSTSIQGQWRYIAIDEKVSIHVQLD